MGNVGRNENTKYEFWKMIYRAKRCGLNAGQRKIWDGLVKWFDENVDGPSVHQLAEISGVSTSLVYWTIPVLEELEIITVARGRNGYRIRGSLRLWKYPDSSE